MAPSALTSPTQTSSSIRSGLLGEQAASLVRLFCIAILFLFTAPVLVALAIVAVWFVFPSPHGRGRHLRPLIAPALGGCLGLALWMLLSSHSPPADAIGVAAEAVGECGVRLRCGGARLPSAVAVQELVRSHSE